MLKIRKSKDRGYADHGWLKSYHSFSFANYYDANHMGFANLRVINEDRIQAGMGFSTHAHNDMEIISYVISGSLSHKDSLGNEVVIYPGELQRMTAGTGVMHSEFNHAAQESHFLQIWIEPSSKQLTPSYAQKMFTTQEKTAQLKLIGSPDGSMDSIVLNADAKVYAGLFDNDTSYSMSLSLTRSYYVFLIKGTLIVNDQLMSAGDAVMLTQEANLAISQAKDAEVLVFDLQF